jgi:hypothetical protein
MLTPKQLVRGVFESTDLPRLPFIPWVFTHAARLEQIPVRRMSSDPTQYTKCLLNAQKLYGYDAIVGSFDLSLEMEICGCPLSWRGDYETPTARPNPGFDLARLNNIDVDGAAKTGRFGTVVESLRRVNRVAGSNLALAAVVTGPLTLLAGLTGKDPLKDSAERPEETVRDIDVVAAFLLKVVQVYCQLELDIIAIVERPIASCPPDFLSRLGSVFSPIVNTVRFYNAFSVLLPGEPSPDNLANLLDLGFNGIVAPGIAADAWDTTRSGRPCVLGQAIPVRFLNSDSGELRTYLETHLPETSEPGVFLTTDWELPPETPPDNVHLLMNMMRKSGGT